MTRITQADIDRELKVLNDRLAVRGYHDLDISAVGQYGYYTMMAKNQSKDLTTNNSKKDVYKQLCFANAVFDLMDREYS